MSPRICISVLGPWTRKKWDTFKIDALKYNYSVHTHPLMSIMAIFGVNGFAHTCIAYMQDKIKALEWQCSLVWNVNQYQLQLVFLFETFSWRLLYALFIYKINTVVCCIWNMIHMTSYVSQVYQYSMSATVHWYIFQRNPLRGTRSGQHHLCALEVVNIKYILFDFSVAMATHSYQAL